jgi:MFS superfamily sulfate permease-like transporter
VLAGTFRLGKLVEKIPVVVLEGVLSAIGLIIAIDQLYVLWGDRVPDTIIHAFQGVVPAFFFALRDPAQVPILLCGVLALVVKLGWNVARRRSTGVLALIPAALPAVTIATLASLSWKMPRVEIAGIFGQMAGSAHQFFSFEWLHAPLLPFLIPALMIAVVASSESLLTARGVDVLAKDIDTHRPADLDRELIAQGAANSVSGIFGGLPITAVMVRSSVNVNSGARTQWSSVFHGVWLCTFVALLPGVLTHIPLTALAAVLIVTGFRLLNVGGIRRKLRSDPIEGLLWVGTIFAIVTTDLLAGLGLSLFTAVLVQKMPAHWRRSLAK